MKVLQLAQIVFGINDFKHRATLFFFLLYLWVSEQYCKEENKAKQKTNSTGNKKLNQTKKS